MGGVFDLGGASQEAPFFIFRRLQKRLNWRFTWIRDVSSECIAGQKKA